MKLVSIALIVIGLLGSAATLPVERGIRLVFDWVEGLGPVAPLASAGIYLLVAVLMIPAAAVSVVAMLRLSPTGPFNTQNYV